MLKIKKGIKVSKHEESRETWPFVDMQVGDVVDVDDKSQWKAAQKRACNVALIKGWTITTKWIEDYGRIRRVK